MDKTIDKMTFEEWFENRTNMTLSEYRYKLISSIRQQHYRQHKECFKQLPSESFYEEYADKSIKNYKAIYNQRRLEYCYLNEKLTFDEWLEIYKGHTPESFYKNCTDTGMTYKQYSFALDWLRKRYEAHQLNVPLEAQNPFLGG